MKNKGFTLVELAVTLILVIILMSISVPIYRKNTKNYEKAEGYALLASIRSAQEAYYVQYGTFLMSAMGSGGPGKSQVGEYWYTCNEEVLGINARTNKYFTYFNISSEWNYPNNTHRFIAVVTGSPGVLRMTYDLTAGVTIS
ncbi:MAG: prepilin-type N-terminal cleavage/methylation domain-containing protein [Elusimicrobia bacterium]|nr:prepilin-type N-terminal cleavage/methylation domain-containing protein [Elusimicrobiota bacterium]